MKINKKVYLFTIHHDSALKRGVLFEWEKKESWITGLK